jgi:uncharacterized protein YkwD
MRKFALLAFVLLVGCHRDIPPLPPTPPVDIARATADLIAAHNTIRSANGVPPLTQNLQLQAASDAHAIDMAVHTFMSHKGSDWSSPYSRMKKAGYVVKSTAGENVAMGQADVQVVMRAWMSDIGHRRNVLNKSYKDIGAAVRVGRNGRPYWVTDFGG